MSGLSERELDDRAAGRPLAGLQAVDDRLRAEGQTAGSPARARSASAGRSPCLRSRVQASAPPRMAMLVAPSGLVHTTRAPNRPSSQAWAARSRREAPGASSAGDSMQSIARSAAPSAPAHTARKNATSIPLNNDQSSAPMHSTNGGARYLAPAGNPAKSPRAAQSRASTETHATTPAQIMSFGPVIPSA